MWDAGEPSQRGEASGGAVPVSGESVGTSGADDGAERERYDDGVVGVADGRDEIGTRSIGSSRTIST